VPDPVEARGRSGRISDRTVRTATDVIGTVSARGSGQPGVGIDMADPYRIRIDAIEGRVQLRGPGSELHFALEIADHHVRARLPDREQQVERSPQEEQCD